MLLYDHPMAPNPRRVRIFLAEKGVTIPTRELDLIGLEHKRRPDQSASGRSGAGSG